MDELVTVIIPVYNARSHLRRCVHSVCGQTHPHLQVVLVDDGSTDGSGAICDDLARQDDRIQVIHRQNGGVSAARNTGLDHARGGWIAFVDADDYVSPHYIKDLRTAAGDSCDMAIGRAVTVSANEGNAPFRRLSDIQIRTGRDACIHHFNNHALYNACWGRIGRAHLWQGVRFPEGKLGEDLFVSHTVLYRAERIALTDAALYAYVQSENSLMRSDFSVRRLDMLDGWVEAVRFFTEVDEPQIADIARRTYCGRVFDARYVCKTCLPPGHQIHGQLRARAAIAYDSAKGIRSYIDRNRRRTLAHRLMLLLGRRCLPLYGALFVRGKWRETI